MINPSLDWLVFMLLFDRVPVRCGTLQVTVMNKSPLATASMGMEMQTVGRRSSRSREDVVVPEPRVIRRGVHGSFSGLGSIVHELSLLAVALYE